MEDWGWEWKWEILRPKEVFSKPHLFFIVIQGVSVLIIRLSGLPDPIHPDMTSDVIRMTIFNK